MKALQEREAAGWYYVRSYQREREKGGGREMVRATGVGVIDALSLSLSLSRSCAPIVRRVASKRRRRRRWSNFCCDKFLSRLLSTSFLEMDKKEILSRSDETLENDDDDDMKKKDSQKYMYAKKRRRTGTKERKKALNEIIISHHFERKRPQLLRVDARRTHNKSRSMRRAFSHTHR